MKFISSPFLFLLGSFFSSSYRLESRDDCGQLKTLKISKEVICRVVDGSVPLFTSRIHLECLKMTHVPKLDALVMRTTRQDVSITREAHSLYWKIVVFSNGTNKTVW